MTAARADDVLGLAQALVAVPSVSGNEAAVVETIRGVLASWGLAPLVSGRNVWCRVDGNRPGRTLLLQSHIDTVPASPEWALARQLEELLLVRRTPAISIPL